MKWVDNSETMPDRGNSTRPLRVFLPAYLAAIAILGGAVVLWQWKGIPIGDLTRDPANILNAAFYIGSISSIGILMWTATASLCLFTGFLGWREFPHSALSRFLIASGLLTAALLFDDLFLFHEKVFPHRLHIPEYVLYSTYAFTGLAFLFIFRRVIKSTRFLVLFAAGGFLGISMIVDTLTNNAQDTSIKFLVEDGLKFFGIVSWFAYYVQICLVAFSARMAHPSWHLEMDTLPFMPHVHRVISLVRRRWAVLAAAVALGLAGALLVVYFTAPLAPRVVLDGSGRDLDSVAFWIDEEADSTRLFVTAQKNQLVEVWRFPFGEKEQQTLPFPAGSTVNGVAVDLLTDRLYVSDSGENEGIHEVHVYSLPLLEPLYRFGRGIIGEGETNLAILHHDDGSVRVYVTEDHRIHIFRAGSDAASLLGHFAPPVTNIETVMADDHAQLIFVPEERGGAGKSPGIHVFDADGKPLRRDGSNVFGSDGIFQADAEGIALYRCLDETGTDSGRGFIVVSDQRLPLTDFEFFDRRTWRHLGTLHLGGVGGTDGVAVLETPLPGYPLGVFAAVHDDRRAVVVGWREILEELALPDMEC